MRLSRASRGLVVVAAAALAWAAACSGTGRGADAGGSDGSDGSDTAGGADALDAADTSDLPWSDQSDQLALSDREGSDALALSDGEWSDELALSDSEWSDELALSDSEGSEWSDELALSDSEWSDELALSDSEGSEWSEWSDELALSDSEGPDLVGCQSVADCPLPQPCRLWVCEDGQCVDLALADGLACDDANPCTVGDACAGGACQSGKVKECGDGNPCTVNSCDPAAGECESFEVDWPCDDGNACTQEDACVEGVCLGPPVSCDDGNPCTGDSCQPVGGCAYKPLTLPCDDGNPCTLGDVCVGGGCKAGPTMLSCEDGNPCTADGCDPEAGKCKHVPLAGPCDDGNACTTGDHCEAGYCLSGSYDLCDCTSDADCIPFDDGDPCNGTLACDQAQWPYKCRVKPGSAVTCDPAADTACAKNQCLPLLAACAPVPANEGGACTDGDACTTGDHCAGGICVGQTSTGCDDGNPCTDDSCDKVKGCKHAVNTLPCDDGNVCTLGDSCFGGNCVGSLVICLDGNPCTVEACDPASGECVFAVTPSSCNDGNACTKDDKCEDGFCLGQPVPCEDGLPCTVDWCEESKGCVHQPVSGGCTDGSLCTVNDHCEGIICVGTAVSCDDQNACTNDQCKPAAGCVHTFNEAPCDDGNACTYGDKCVSGECTAWPVDCNDGNPCMAWACHPYAGCVFTKLEIPCDDKNPCTVGDWCQDGECLPGVQMECEDGNECTLDWCRPNDGECVSEPKGSLCDDGSKCTTDDLCQDGACIGFSVDCNDFDPCTSDACDEEEGCVHVPLDGAPCSDGNKCTLPDVCSGGECAGTGSLDCDDGNACTADSCAPASGCQHAGLTGGPCDDGNAGTVDDACAKGKCAGHLDDDGDGVGDKGWGEVCAAGESDGCDDNCAGVKNPAQEDGDGDGIGDACEVCGPVQVIDGSVPPDAAAWFVPVAGECEEGNQAFADVLTQGGEPALEATAARLATCEAGSVSVAVVAARDLSAGQTVVVADVEFAAVACPVGSLPYLARVVVAGTGGSVPVYFADHEATTAECGDATGVAAGHKRSTWRLEVSAGDKLVHVERNGVELADSPFDLGALSGPWRLRFEAQSAGLPGSETEAVVRVFGYAIECAW